MGNSFSSVPLELRSWVLEANQNGTFDFFFINKCFGVKKLCFVICPLKVKNVLSINIEETKTTF